MVNEGLLLEDCQFLLFRLCSDAGCERSLLSLELLQVLLCGPHLLSDVSLHCLVPRSTARRRGEQNSNLLHCVEDKDRAVLPLSGKTNLIIQCLTELHPTYKSGSIYHKKK